MRSVSACISLAILAAYMADSRAQAQEISGFSTVSDSYVCTGTRCNQKGVPTTYNAVEAAYVDTEEDYTASLYYDVSSASAMYYGGNRVALNGGSVTGNPSASGSYSVASPVLGGTLDTCVTQVAIAPYGPKTYCDSLTPGLYTETTDHIVDMFYVTSVGNTTTLMVSLKVGRW